MSKLNRGVVKEFMQKKAEMQREPKKSDSSAALSVFSPAPDGGTSIGVDGSKVGWTTSSEVISTAISHAALNSGCQG
jgi:hypothetical protein